MKIRTILAAMLAALLLFGILTGCGSDSSASSGFGGVANDAIAEGDFLYGSGYETPAQGVSDTVTDQKLVKTVSMTAETEDLDALLNSLDEKIASLGGYMESRNVYNGSSYSTRSRYADMTIRIPAEVLNEFVEQMEGMSNIISSNQAIDDVTLTYVATESRMNALQAEEARLLELMEQAETMSDLLEVEARLTDVRYELESVTSQMRVLENQVSYATVELSVSEVREYTVVEEQSPLQRMSEGFVASLKGLWNGIVELAVFVVAKLPYLVVAAVIITLVVLLLKRRRKKPQPPKAPENTPNP